MYRFVNKKEDAMNGIIVSAGGEVMLNAEKKNLAKLLLEKSYREGNFTLASGRKSDYYFDCRVTALSAKGSALIGLVLNQMLADEDIRGVGGMTLGADPLVTAVTVLSNGRLDGLYVRKEPKDHGTGKQVEGLDNFNPGDRVAVLEDVVTTGGSLLKAVRAIEAAGLNVALTLAILDRGEGGRHAIETAGYRFASIFTRSELLAAGKN